MASHLKVGPHRPHHHCHPHTLLQQNSWALLGVNILCQSSRAPGLEHQALSTTLSLHGLALLCTAMMELSPSQRHASWHAMHGLLCSAHASEGMPRIPPFGLQPLGLAQPPPAWPPLAWLLAGAWRLCTCKQPCKLFGGTTSWGRGTGQTHWCLPIVLLAHPWSRTRHTPASACWTLLCR